MGFDSEKQLKERALPALYDEVGREGTEVVHEFSYSAGWTDLVFTYTSEKYLNRRVSELEIESSIEDKDRLKSFLRIQKRDEITKDYFFELSTGAGSGAREDLEWLIDNNFVIESSDGKIRSAPNLRRHITTSMAVELKLSKWKQALKQAVRARSFAKYQYVVMDERYVGRALKNQDQFKEYGVGLISVSTDGTLRNYISPKKKRPFSELQAWKLNEQTFQSTLAP